MGRYKTKCEKCGGEFESIGELTCLTCGITNQAAPDYAPKGKLPRVWIDSLDHGWHFGASQVFAYKDSKDGSAEYLSLDEAKTLVKEEGDTLRAIIARLIGVCGCLEPCSCAAIAENDANDALGRSTIKNRKK